MSEEAIVTETRRRVGVIQPEPTKSLERAECDAQGPIACGG